MTTLGYELQQRGHRVTLFGIPDARAKTLAVQLSVGEASRKRIAILFDNF